MPDFEPSAGFRDIDLPVDGALAGYAALIATHDLPTPSPRMIHLVASKAIRRKERDVNVLPRSAWPGASTYRQLKFALKYEGVNLAVLKAAFAQTDPQSLAECIRSEITGKYARRIWFLYEFLLEKELPLTNAASGGFTPIVEGSIQFGLAGGPRSQRHRTINNLLGDRNFCPTVYKTRAIERFIAADLGAEARETARAVPADVLKRAAAFLLLSDSKASFGIEGEQASDQRLRRWAEIIGRAGRERLTVDSLVELQRAVIGDARFVKIGLRQEGGFIGRHSATGDPVPEHISARPEDLNALLNGLIELGDRAEQGTLDPVVEAACQAFGFVIIHPFEDGNGRIHRYLIHDVLARRRLSPEGLVFPISHALLENIAGYKNVLETVTRPLQDFIDWKPTPKGNILVLNNTIDLYRYFDATPLVEFLFSMIEHTIKTDLPEELFFIEARDAFHRMSANIVDMPERTLDLMIKFLRQNGGRLSKRAKEQEFEALTDTEAEQFQQLYLDCFKPEDA